jgi:hypothetical protein
MTRLRPAVATLLLAVLACGSGVHLAALQTAAWAGMLWTYSSTESSITEAARKTFSGEHPCKLCMVVKQASKESPSSPAKAVETAKRFDLLAAETAAELASPFRGTFTHPRPADLAAEARREAPPVPVPIVG